MAIIVIKFQVKKKKTTKNVKQILIKKITYINNVNDRIRIELKKGEKNKKIKKKKNRNKINKTSRPAKQFLNNYFNIRTHTY